jgi:hypothetical protein
MKSESLDTEETYSFSTEGRERYVPVMMKVGYVELEKFEGKESDIGYWCESCVWYVHRKDSPTGSWCNKFGFPDRGFGCCGGYRNK